LLKKIYFKRVFKESIACFMWYDRVHWSLEQDSITTNHESFWCLFHKHIHNIYHASHKLIRFSSQDLNIRQVTQSHFLYSVILQRKARIKFSSKKHYYSHVINVVCWHHICNINLDILLYSVNKLGGQYSKTRKI